MENLINFFETNLDYYLLIMIILSGIFITKYTAKIKIENTYKVLISSILISSVFYFIEDCNKSCLNKYLFTYFFATSFYELIVRVVLNKVKEFIKK
jgi:hypothetical protein